jgi:hypothetical protein
MTRTTSRVAAHTHPSSSGKAAASHAHDVDVTDLEAAIAKLNAAVFPVVPPPVVDPPPIPGPLPMGTTPPKALRDAIAAGSDATALMLAYLVSAAELDMDGLTAKVKQLHLDAWRGRHVYNGGITQTSVPAGGPGADAGLFWLTGDYQDIVLERLILTGSQTGAPGVNEANHAIHPQGGANLTVKGCVIGYFGGDGLYSGGWLPSGARQNTNLTFIANAIADCGRMGVGAAGGLITALIDGNHFDRLGWYPTLDIEPNGDAPGGKPETYTDITFSNNQIGRPSAAALALGRDRFTFVVSSASYKGATPPVLARIAVTNNQALYADNPWHPSIASQWAGAVTQSGNK